MTAVLPTSPLLLLHYLVKCEAVFWPIATVTGAMGNTVSFDDVTTTTISWRHVDWSTHQTTSVCLDLVFLLFRHRQEHLLK